MQVALTHSLTHSLTPRRQNNIASTSAQLNPVAVAVAVVAAPAAAVVSSCASRSKHWCPPSLGHLAHRLAMVSRATILKELGEEDEDEEEEEEEEEEEVFTLALEVCM